MQYVTSVLHDFKYCLADFMGHDIYQYIESSTVCQSLPYRVQEFPSCSLHWKSERCMSLKENLLMKLKVF